MSVNFNKLDAALKKMGGALRKFPIKKIKSIDPIEIKIKKGVSISRGEFDKIKPVAGFLNVEGHHAFLYIDQPFASQEDLEEIPSENGPRFHIVKECKTLQKMHKDKRSDRYILIQNINGEFPCNPRDPLTRIIDTKTKIPAKLLACHNCMMQLDYLGFSSKKNYSQRQQIRNLDLNKFLKHYNPFFIDSRYYRKIKDEDRGNYSVDHAKIRDRLLKQTDYTCQGSELGTGKCDVQLKDHPEWLHMHHINGRSGDNSPRNIKILCISCHQRQPLHEKMNVPARAINEIARRRRKITNEI
tara:strand:- start:8 stop:904 length:897 start_codon:yes stop_codon:yes gene_type:complete